MSDDNAHNDLYEDLADAKIASTASTSRIEMKPSTAAIIAATKPSSFSEQVDNLQKKVEDLDRENHQLKRNIGTLFRTAKNEIKRKDDQIARLMQELDEKR
jgi:predicted RNase H-like nuclease (RuvC/YqgF family)